MQNTTVQEKETGLPEKYLRIILRILDRELTITPCEVYLFGSRAGKTARPASDIDLAVDTPERVENQIVRAKTAFEEAEIPFTIDIVDCKHASRNLQSSIRKTGKQIWKN